MNHGDIKKENKWIFFSVFSIIAAFLTIILVLFFGLNNLSLFEKIGKLGPVGDLIGGSTIAFFNLASFLMLIAAIVMQKEELTLQRSELKMQRDELERTRHEYELSNKTMIKQQFDSTFFNMVKLHNDIVDSIKFSDKQGRNALSTLLDYFAINTSGRTENNNSETFQLIKDLYNDFFNDYEHILGHYFRNLYRIVKYIDQSELEDKSQYIGIIRAQLSKDELVLLFYNAISEQGEKFKKLIIKYDFFDDHLKYSSLVHPHHKDFLK